MSAFQTHQQAAAHANNLLHANDNDANAPAVIEFMEERLGIYPVVDSSDWIKKLTDEGIKTIQLRIKDATEQQKQTLLTSDDYVNELKAADVLVIATPIYNFHVPAALKAWVDLVARARETFRYTETGPVGLLKNKKAYIIVTSGGTALQSEYDFVTAWLTHILSFIGIEDVTYVDASALMINENEVISRAASTINQIANA